MATWFDILLNNPSNFATDFPYLYVWREEVQRSGTFDKFYKNLFCKMRLLETVVMTDDS